MALKDYSDNEAVRSRGQDLVPTRALIYILCTRYICTHYVLTTVCVYYIYLVVVADLTPIYYGTIYIRYIYTRYELYI